MKYIRTDKGIYRTNGGTEVCIDGYWLSIDDIKKFIIKPANLIEELCDCFIGEFVNGEKVILEKWNGNKFVIRWATNMVSMIKDLNKTYANVKGAIWTNKGLIYVAKMNEKGELELI